MVTREELVAELQKVPERHLAELYRIIKEYEVESGEDESSHSVMEELRRIRISASPDFSINANLHDLQEQNVK